MTSRMAQDDDGSMWAAGVGADINDENCSVLRWVSMLLGYDEVTSKQRNFAFVTQVHYASLLWPPNESNKRGSRKR